MFKRNNLVHVYCEGHWTVGKILGFESEDLTYMVELENGKLHSASPFELESLETEQLPEMMN